MAAVLSWLNTTSGKTSITWPARPTGNPAARASALLRLLDAPREPLEHGPEEVGARLTCPFLARVADGGQHVLEMEHHPE